jgi:hypothetical protein
MRTLFLNVATIKSSEENRKLPLDIIQTANKTPPAIRLFLRLFPVAAAFLLSLPSDDNRIHMSTHTHTQEIRRWHWIKRRDTAYSTLGFIELRSAIQELRGWHTHFL